MWWFSLQIPFSLAFRGDGKPATLAQALSPGLRQARSRAVAGPPLSAAAAGANGSDPAALACAKRHLRSAELPGVSVFCP